jgi:hypothetical protein
MSIMRLTIFIIALLLAVSAIEPTGPWLVALAVLSGLSLFFGRRGRRFGWRRMRGWTGGRWAEEHDW